ncbi:hypothetical protein [Macromonas bipunctata]|uniref:hypothetical protein n=1 Tax=Macromonas bipunctata TaxID=183670 RepID=UPI0011AF9770|nr:hypothetical protein [Macromonas bipunctata]
MTDIHTKNLELIVEAIKYCKKVKDMGMPKSCYSKALREPVFFLWEKKYGINKYSSSKYRSVAAQNIPDNNGNLVYDHAIPFKYILEKALSMQDVNTNTVKDLLDQNLFACTITKEEDAALFKHGLAHKMPKDWDGLDALSRYKSAGIEVVEQNK